MAPMRMLRIAVAVALFALGACSDEKKDPPVTQDASIDAPAQQIDAPMGNACTGATYDPCTAPTQCTSGNCHLYAAQNLQVCVTTCTAGDNTTCPRDSSGAYGTCNNMGICKPVAANNCTR